jgi:single-strand DNA-binding protein
MTVNKAILVGKLTKDPELKYTPGGKAVCNFSLVTTEEWNNAAGEPQESKTFHKIVAWGKQAEVIKEHLSEGSECYIEGRIDNRSYDKQDGTKGYVSEVVVERCQFLDRKPATKPPAQADDDQSDLPF